MSTVGNPATHALADSAKPQQNRTNGGCSATDLALAAWQRVEEAFRAFHHGPDVMAIRATYAAAAAHYLPGQPVWLFDVAASSSGKTGLLMPLRGAGAIVISTVTPQTFISGWTWRKQGEETGRDASLLTKLGSGIIVCKDFSQVLSMPRKQRGPILADLRDIYDGYIAKEYGTGERKEWAGRITLLAGVTQDIDRHYTIYQSLGERFLQVRWKRPGGVQAGLKAMGQTREGQEDLSEAVRELFQLLPKGGPNPQVSEANQFRIANLAEFAVRARTHVPRDGRSREIIYLPEAEASPRMTQQLAQLGRGSALLEGRSEVNEADLALVRRVAFDSLPASRRAVLDCLVAEVCKTGAAIEDATGLSHTAVVWQVEELRGLGLVAKAQPFSDDFALLSDEAKRLLRAGFGFETVP